MAVPIFYSAVVLALVLSYQLSLGRVVEPATIASAAGLASALFLGTVMRTRLIRRHRLLGQTHA